METTISKVLESNETFLVPGRHRQKMADMQYSVCLHPHSTHVPLILITFSCIGVIGLGIYLLQQGMVGIGIYNIKDLYLLGFGSVNANSIVAVAPTGLIATTLFANLPQGILSFLYLTYNGLFTCMLGSYEWSRFARFRKPLRVTAPIESQRSTYYLQLPYTYAIVCLFSLLPRKISWKARLT
jgi:hypothetical protein